MRTVIAPFVVALILATYPAADVYAQQEPPVDTKEVMDKANHLKILLDDLLSHPNSSSIPKAVTSGDEEIKPLLDKALEFKKRRAAGVQRRSEATRLLKMAKAARGRADADSRRGRNEETLAE